MEIATNPDETGALRKIRSGQYELIAKTELVKLRTDLEQSKKDADIARRTGRYQIHKEGVRTWRLDTATGRTCLLLTTEEDWKGKGKDETSCATEDLYRHDSQ